MRALAGLAAYLLVLAGGTPAVGGHEAHEAGHRPPVGVTAPVRVTPDTGTTARTYVPAAVVADLDEPMRLFAAGVDLRSRRCSFHRSNDGGRTWTGGASPSPPAYPFCSHVAPFMPMGDLAVDGSETLYYLHRGWSHQDDGPEPNRSVLLSRSDDGGDTWTTTVVRNARTTRAPDNEVDYPTDVAVDTRGSKDTVYVTWTTTYPSAVPRKPTQPSLAVSSDGGRTFSAPTSVTGSFFDDPANLTGDIDAALKKKEHFGGALPYMVIEENGAVSVTWVRRTANIGTVVEPRYLSRSTDGGRTFSVSELAPPGPLSNGGAVLAWTPAASPTGTLHTVYEDKAGAVQGDRDVHYRRSTDGGKTWSEPAVINDDDPPQLFSQLLPTIAAAPGGRLDVAWWDTRNSVERYATDVYYASSDDSGATWSKNIPLTPRPVGRLSGSWVENFGNTRQAPGLAAGAEVTTLLWDGTGDGTPPSAVQDLYATAVQYRPLPAPPSSALTTYLAAAAAGVLVGLAVMAFRRRIGGVAPSARPPGSSFSDV